MGLESFTAGTIDTLNINNPTGEDVKSQGDNHIRGMKTVLNNTFRKADASTPWDTALAVDEDDVNNGFVPVGGIIIWSGAISAIPTNWGLCNGTANNSPGSGIDLTDKFVLMADSDSGGTNDVGDTGGSWTSGATAAAGTTDGHAITEAEMPAHTHSYATKGGTYNGTNGAVSGVWRNGTTAPASGSTGGGAAHTHTFTSAAHTHTVANPYYALAYIERVS